VSEREWISPDALRRIEQQIEAKGPAIVRRARVVRRVQQIAIGGAATIAVALAFVLTKAPAPEVTQIAEAGPACSKRAAPSVAEQRTGGAVAFDLGLVANAKLLPGAVGSVREVTACRTVFVLETGRIDVHARDLGGGELIVEAGSRRVTVHGTIFSVERQGEMVAVDVTEGVVAVSGHGKRLRAGDRVELREPVAVVEPEVEENDEPEIEEPRRVKREKPRARKRHVKRPKPKRFSLDLGSYEEEPEEPAPKFEPALDPPVSPPKQVAPPEPEEESPDDLVRLAARLRKLGDVAGARKLYRRAGALRGPTAEAAWIALARLEIDLKQGPLALAALREHGDRFSGGTLAIDARWLRVQAHELAGDRSAAEREARALVRRWPDTEQARSAKAWLERSD
jgi:hypothetical protein